ncbi:MAG: hypothetical protein HY587_01050 [Candidatus Omnitrophica bacterium]|nr:hypothetical protein [Candidatus Omnitrophota bacterium]
MAIVRFFFFWSGFSSLLYQIVWLRLAIARFGVNAPVVSSVLTVFMSGLALGSYLGGKFSSRFGNQKYLIQLRPYALLEFTIGLGGLLAPAGLLLGRRVMLSLSMESSAAYFACSLFMIFIILFPFCTAMGATYPFALSFLKKLHLPDEEKQFSDLYLCNVAGSILGVLIPTFITIELWGFQKTLWLAVLINLMIAVLAWRYRVSAKYPATETICAEPADYYSERAVSIFPRAAVILFIFGMCSMGLEVIWTRIYTPYIGTWVYSFAGILAIYLVFTNLGTATYRLSLFRSAERHLLLLTWLFLAPSAFLMLIACNPDFSISPFVRLLIGVAPFSFMAGILTPCLIEIHSRSEAKSVGTLYAANLLGCVVGPLVTGFLLIPFLNYRTACYLLVFLLLLTFLWGKPHVRVAGTAENGFGGRKLITWGVPILIFGLLSLFGKPYESRFREAVVLHDYAATVIASGQGMDKQLRVNGQRATHLTTITKMMAHLPLAYLNKTPERGLVICLGMGTTFRSMSSWGIDSTVVELIPSVAKTVSYFFADIDEILRGHRARARIIIDDGRRFLDRTSETYDVIAVDPPPPVETAQSSLLYSREFYQSVKRVLRKDGILQNWLPQAADAKTVAAVLKALREEFAYVRIFNSLEGHGLHFLASMAPIPGRSPAELFSRLPESAKKDFLEWEQNAPEEIFESVLRSEKDPDRFLMSLGLNSAVTLTDDRAVNEYWFLRALFPEPHRTAEVTLSR